MTLDKAIQEWKSANRRMGCVSAANWLCDRVEGFRPLRLDRYTEDGEIYQHVVCTDGTVVVDLAPYNDRPREG